MHRAVACPFERWVIAIRLQRRENYNKFVTDWVHNANSALWRWRLLALANDFKRPTTIALRAFLMGSSRLCIPFYLLLVRSSKIKCTFYVRPITNRFQIECSIDTIRRMCSKRRAWLATRLPDKQTSNFNGSAHYARLVLSENNDNFQTIKFKSNHNNAAHNN